MSQSMPPPLVPPHVDLRDFDGFMLNVNRLLASELVALGTPEECWAALMLWCRAWHQQPAASLPDDDRVLAAFSGAGKRWGKVKAMALRGFVRCSDGRLYHKVLAEDAERAWTMKLERRERTRKATEARRAQRDEQRSDHRNGQRDVERDVERDDALTMNVTKSQGQGQKKEEREPTALANGTVTQDGEGPAPRRMVVVS